MIKSIQLDQESFEQIFEDAKKRIPVIFPAWTNYNTNDTGIAIIELLAWLEQMQIYHLDQIGDKHLKTYLKLLGIIPDDIYPASTIVRCYNVHKDIFLKKGYKFIAGDVDFESVEPLNIYSGKITKISSCYNDEIILQRQITPKRDLIHFYPFSKSPKAGYEFIMYFDKPFVENGVYSFYFSINQSKKRNPPSEYFIPLAQIQVFYNDGQKIQCKIIKDTTYSFLYSGILKIQIPKDIKNTTECKIHICLICHEYEIPPIIEYIDLNSVEVRQYHTIAECSQTQISNSDICYSKTEFGYKQVLNLNYDNAIWCKLSDELTSNYIAKANGFPNQKIYLGFPDIWKETLKIMISNPEYPEYFEIWEQKEDFYSSKPDDRHFIFDAEKSMLIFGDGIHGLPPEGEILLLSAKQSKGIGGNVKSHMIETKDNTFFDCTNEQDVINGKNRESILQCFDRFQFELEQNNCAVTDEDYQTIIKNTPALMIDNVKVVNTDAETNKVFIAVKPWSSDVCPDLTDSYIKNIKNHVSKYRLIGTDIQILKPEYIDINVYLDVNMSTYHKDYKQFIREKLCEYINKYYHDFGSTLIYSKLYAFLDSIDGIDSINSLSIDTNNQWVTKSINGDIISPQNGLIYLDDFVCSAYYV